MDFTLTAKLYADAEGEPVVYEETYRSLRQLRDDLGKLIERTERRINEVTEMQRLAEDRLKHDWTSFLADDAKRWNAHKLTLEEQWREHGRLHDKLSSSLASHEERLSSATERLKVVEDEARSRLTELHALLRDWALEGERPSKEPKRAR
jgi:chromosome segregation ATPase